MSVAGVTPKCFILALFKRDDGERFLLGDGAYQFAEKQQHFTANTFENDVVNVQGNDGSLLAGQVRRASNQDFDGYVGDASVQKTDIEQYRRDFLAFFAKNHHYTVVYVMPDGSAIKRQRGYIVDAPEVKELWQIHPEYHVSLSFEDVNYYTYAEDAEGDEIYGQSITVPVSTAAKGGLIWDEYGVVWDALGATWELGSGTPGPIVVDSISTVYPVWTVTGTTVNPTLENTTTGTSIRYNGTVTASQTLVIDMLNQTAKLNGTNVLGNVEGDWITLAPGTNQVSYNADNASVAPNAKLEYAEIVG